MKSLSSEVFSIPFFINRTPFNPIQIVTLFELVSEHSCYFCYSDMKSNIRIRMLLSKSDTIYI